MKKRKKSNNKKQGNINKGQGIAIIIIIIILIKILTRCDFDEITNKNQDVLKDPKFECAVKNLSKKECNELIKKKKLDKEKFKEIIEKIKKEGVKKIEEDYGIKDKYLCILKDASNAEIAEWTLSVSKTMGTFAQKYFVENSCCPEKGKRFAIYDKEYPAKLKWFDLIDQDLYFDSLELSDNKVRHNNFSIKLEGTDYKKFNKLYNKAEIAKKDHDAELISTNTYVIEEEKFYYTSNAFFRENMKDNNNFTTLIDADCE